MERPRELRGWPLLAATSPTERIPFGSVVGNVHKCLEAAGLTYAVIGGVAVARAGVYRTTGDIDLLLRREEWRRVVEAPERGEIHPNFGVGYDWATHKASGLTINLRFSGEGWGLPFLLPDPAMVREWDVQAEAWFIRPASLLELKAAVYQSKLQEFGVSVAAKDLYDVSTLLSARQELRKAEMIDRMHRSVRETLRKAVADIEREEKSGPKRPK